MDVLILWGLPGSGKTYYAKKIKKENIFKDYDKDNVAILNFDKILSSLNKKRNTPVYNFLKEKKEDVNFHVWRSLSEFSNSYYKEDCDIIIVDSLVYNNESAQIIIDFLNSYFENSVEFAYSCIKYKIICWELDRETCIYNDHLRTGRAKSRRFIERANYEKPSNEFLELNEISPEDVEFKKVEKSSKIEALLIDHKNVENMCLKSKMWLVCGADGGNCWGGVAEPIPSFEIESPVEFDELDSFLEENYPKLSFQTYKRIRKECVIVKDHSETEYYGNYHIYNYYVCDLEKLFKIIYEEGLKL